MEAAADSSKPTSAEAPAGPSDHTTNTKAAPNVMSSLAGLGSSSSEDEKKDIGGTTEKNPSSAPLPPQQQQPKQNNSAADVAMPLSPGSNVDSSAAPAAAATTTNDSSVVNKSGATSGGGDAMEVDEPTNTGSAAAADPSVAIAPASKPAATIGSLSETQPPSAALQQSAKTKARGIIATLEASGNSAAFASKPAAPLALPSAAIMANTGDGKKKKKEKDDKKKTSKKTSSADGKKDKVKKKKVRLLVVFL